MKNLSIQLKFLVSSALITLLTLVMLGILQSLSNEQTEAMVELDISGRQRMLSQKITKEALLLQQGKGSESKMEEAMDLFADSLDILQNGGEVKFLEYKAHLHAAEKDIESALSAQAKSWKEFKSLAEDVAQGNEEAVVDLLDASEDLLKVCKETVVEIEEHVIGDFRAPLRFVQILMLITILIVVLNALFIQKGILDPVKGIAGVVKSIAEGDLSQRFTHNSDDEIGQLVTGLSQMADNLQSKGKLLEQVASGDLTVTGLSTSHFDSLGKSMEHMVENLNALLSQFAEGADQTLTASTQVASSSSDLSRGASTAAASLEEINSSMNQVSSQVDQATDNAQEANRLSQSARESAETGNDHMTDMVTAMESINESSQEISKIIKVIDDIAFQTNLLALNAAVEAARAGAHGKGFAVVAEEVRNLAARSAEAAKSTADLIEGSTGRVENGLNIANRTADALTQIVEQIKKASDLVGEIAMSSKEQSMSINQISGGLSQIDRVIQQYTANSEQTSSAAEELSGQARQLKESINRFRLKSGGGFSGDFSSGPVQAEAAPDPMIGQEPIGGALESSDSGGGAIGDADDLWG